MKFKTKNGRFEIEVKLEEINPERARKLMKTNTHNRKLRKLHLEKIVEDMEDGLYVFDAMPIRISNEGVLLDGQHRLQAVIDSGCSQEFLVIYGLPPESQAVMDSGARRTAGDVLHLNGFKYSNDLSAATRLILGWERGDRSMYTSIGQYISRQAVVQRAESDPQIAVAVAKPSTFLVSRSVQAFCWYKFQQNDPRLADEFMNAFNAGSELSQGNPVLTLRNRIAQEKSKTKAEIRAQMYIMLFVRAWNAVRRNEKLERIVHKGSYIPEII